MVFLKSIYYSLRFIINFRYQKPALGIIRYLYWGFLKKIHGFPIKVKFSDSFIIFHNSFEANQGGTKLFTCGVYDYDNIMFAKILIGSEVGTFFDVGANIGIYSLILSENPLISVFSFEPHPVTFKVLNNNILNNGRDNIFLFQNVVGAERRKVNFSGTPVSSTNRVITNEGSSSLRLEQIKLSTIIKQYQSLPTVLKIDTEGYEYEVLLGLEEYLGEIKLLIVEISENEDKIMKLVKPFFEGPYYINYGKKLLNYERYYQEDPVFINKKYITQILAQLSFQLK